MPPFSSRKELVALVDRAAATQYPIDPALVRSIQSALQARYPTLAERPVAKKSTRRHARTLIDIDENSAGKHARGCFLVLASVLGIAGLFVGWYVRWHDLFKRPRSDGEERTRRRSSSRCWKCDYPVRDLPAAIEPSQIDGLTLGPLHCPECGERWPLLP